jgi:hypothetical protein
MSKQLGTAEYLAWVCRRVRLDGGRFVTGKQRHEPTWLHALQDLEQWEARGRPVMLSKPPQNYVSPTDKGQAEAIMGHFDRPADQVATPYLCKLIATLKQGTIGTDECGLVASAYMIWDRVEQSRIQWREQQRKRDEQIARQVAAAGARTNARRV